MALTGKHLIDGVFTTSSFEQFNAFNPADGSQLPTAFHETSLDEVAVATAAAQAAFFELRDISDEARAAFLEAMADAIMDLGDTLIERCILETGLPEARLIGERGRTCGQLKLFAGVVRSGDWRGMRIDHAIPDREPLPKPDLRLHRIPLGPVAVFGASNFPLAFSTAGGDTASALAAGCPVIVKGHPAHPGAGELVAAAALEAIKSCNMPKATLQLLQSTSDEVAQALVTAPAIAAVGFTGSLHAGRAIFDAAAARPAPIPVYAEMGSANPVFVFNSSLEADAAGFAKNLAGSITMGVGQFCTNPGLVIVPAGDAAESMISELASALEASPAGTMLHAGIQESYCGELADLAAHGDTQAVVLPEQADEGCQARAALVRTTAKALLEDPTLQDEVFGPSSLVVVCDNEDQFTEVATVLHGHLTTTLHATEQDLADSKLLRILETKAGRILFGGFPTGVEVCPSMQHGGPYPATTDTRSTSVGTQSIDRFVRPVSYQNFPESLLPEGLRDSDSAAGLRLVDNKLQVPE